MYRLIMVCCCIGSLIVMAACKHDKVDVAKESYNDSFVAEPSDDLLATGQRFPRSLNIQILNGNSYGSLPMDPAQLTCPPSSQFSAFAHNWSSPNSCTGYRAATSPLVQLSERQATNFISGITCAAGCTRTQTIVWRGWSCGHNGDENTPPTRNMASGMAVSVVMCRAP